MERRQDASIIGVRRSCLGACVMTDGEFYTSLAESIDPGSAVEFMNRYFSVLMHPVHEHGGFVADLKGDGMLAAWIEGTTPAEVKRRAILACLEIAERARQFSKANSSRGFGTRIGACFGPLALATIGTAAHHEDRVVGDTVNISSRLEQLNKELGTRILICDNLAKDTDEFLFRELGNFQLRGRMNRVRVHELMGLRAAATARQRALCVDFAAALADYQYGRTDQAAVRLRRICSRFPADGPSRYYLERCDKAMSGRVGVARFLEALPLSP